MDPIDRRGRGTRERWLVALVVAGALGAVGTWMTWASYSATLTNEGNQLSTGTVALTDDAARLPLYDVVGGAPGSTMDRCLRVTYDGSLPAAVRLYVSPVAMGDHLDVQLSVGTGALQFPDCAGFVPQGGPLFQGSLGELAQRHGSWADGIEIPVGSSGTWTTGTSVAMHFRVQQLPTDEPVETGPHTYVWEARNR